ncbi:MAG TPA: DNA recombination protein RmuC [Solirubrobacterales bacterium]|nr:DNA recombination protein RmuC [Solirubrobacterales bacterium]
MTVALAIAVVLLAAGLVFLLVSGREKTEVEPEIDLGAAIHEATSKAVADLLRVNEESRKIDTQAAEAALQKREAEFRRLTEPIGKNLERIEKEVSSLSRDRRTADGAMKTLLDEMKAGLGDLGTQTSTLVKALRQPQTRGKWGEVQLKRCVEISGMTEHVDFELQQTFSDGEATLRPDAVVMLPGNRRVVIDSKVPLDAYLEVLEAENDATRKGELIRHARQVRDHITKLSSKRYQDQFASGETPDFVVCFMPSEAALHAAFEAEPSLYDYALEQKVLIATPTTLVGLLRTVELGWRQEQIAEQAQEIAGAARELHSRTAVFLDHFSKAGRQLNSATNAFDEAVGSLQTRIMPQLRRIEEMGAASGKELEEPRVIDRAVRPIAAEELQEIEASAEEIGVPELSAADTPALD